MPYGLWIRPRMLTWGVSPDQTAGAYPDDELVPDVDGGATMATTLPAAPDARGTGLLQDGGQGVYAAPSVRAVPRSPTEMPPQTISWLPVQTPFASVRPRSGAVGSADHRLVDGS